MQNLLSILMFISKFYKAKKLYHRLLLKYLYKYHIDEIIIGINDKYNISEYMNLIDIVKQPSFKGLISGYFYPNDFYPTPLDFAVAINVASNSYYKKESTHINAIIDSAYYISEKLKQRICMDDYLKYLLQISNKSLDKISNNTVRERILDVFSDKKKLFVNYFRTYENVRFSTSVKIWHQSESASWIEWGEDDYILQYMDLNSIREGFFLPGFDYEINGIEDTQKLVSAYKKDGFEYYNNEIPDGEIIWLA